MSQLSMKRDVQLNKAKKNLDWHDLTLQTTYFLVLFLQKNNFTDKQIFFETCFLWKIVFSIQFSSSTIFFIFDLTKLGSKTTFYIPGNPLLWDWFLELWLGISSRFFVVKVNFALNYFRSSFFQINLFTLTSNLVLGYKKITQSNCIDFYSICISIVLFVTQLQR